MEFWGVEVKAGQPLKVKPESGRVIHISQAALGEGKKEKGSELIPLRVKINGDNFVVGSLSVESVPQASFDLVFEKQFELSHDWKNGSVYFCGYSADNPFAEDEDEFEDLDEEEVPLAISENGKVEPKAEEAKPTANKDKAAKPESAAKPKVTMADLSKEVSDEDDETDEDEDESDDEDMMKTLDDMGDSEDENDSDDEDDSEDEEETPKKKAEPSKKRPTESATKTPVPGKKAKLDTPQKTDGKKGGHTATPHPSKQAGKTPANNKPKEQTTPKSDGKVSCKSCNRTFVSDSALQSHTKAKHGGK